MDVLHQLKRSVEQLYTGYFAAVMATGIVSIALDLKGYQAPSLAVFVIGVAVYAALVVAYTLRTIWFPRKVWKDMTNAAKVFGYFTFVAGTNVLAVRFAFDGHYKVSIGLGIVGVVSWFILMYFILVLLVFYNKEPAQNVINGSWLIMTVSTESLAALGSALADFLPQPHDMLLFLSYAYWALGVIIYLIFIAIIMNRFFFHAVKPEDLSPPYWINMGAMAITTLAGSRLILYPHSTNFLVFIEPFVQGFTIMLWVWGTWWIPLLVLMGVYKYIVFRESLRYDPAFWSIVFPLGMYASCTETMSHIEGLHMLEWIVPYSLLAAVIAWTIVSIGFILRRRQRQRQGEVVEVKSVQKRRIGSN